MSIIKVENLNFKIKNNNILKNISFDVKKKSITGLLGPDASGKTTLIRNIVGLLKPDCGQSLVFNLDSYKYKHKLLCNLGYMPQTFGLYEDLTVYENLKLFCSLRDINHYKIEETINNLLKFTNLTQFKNRLSGNLSGGMKQKLGLGCAIMGNPQLLILDEPSVGVDPLSRVELINMIKSLKKNGTTILWATSYLNEIEYFDDVLILNDCHLIYKCDKNTLTSRVKNRVYNIDLKNEENMRSVFVNLIEKKNIFKDFVPQGNYIKVLVYDNVNPNDYPDLVKTDATYEDGVIDLLDVDEFRIPKILNDLKLPDYNIEYPIVAKNLEKKYGDFYAVKNNSFKIKKGEIFGLLGPNGAGKSTTFKMMCSLIKPTFGDVKIMGIDIFKNLAKAKEYIGYMAQKFSLYGNLTVYQNLDFFASLYGLSNQKKREQIESIAKIFNLDKYFDVFASDLSIGFKQRLSLAKSILHFPPCLFLDEPTSGVDPISRREFWNYINILSLKGITVMITTHFMDEASYCDRISLFYKGESIALGTPSDIINKYSKDNTLENAFINLIKQS